VRVARSLVFALYGVTALVVIALVALLMVPHSDAEPKLAGTIISHRPAPGFQLTDQFHHPVSLSRLRGKVVVLTFVQSHCTGTCQLVAEEIHQALVRLGPDARHVAVVAVSVDPSSDTTASIRQFSQVHHLYHRWHYLTASRQVLAKIWKEYYVWAAMPPSGSQADVAHTSATYLIDRGGQERVLLTGALTQSTLVSDLQILAGVPVTAGIQSRVPAPAVGHPAPAIALPALGGGQQSLARWHGKVVVLNYWATWCTACRSEMPRLEKWYRAQRSRGLVIVGVDQEESASDVRSYTRKLGITYPLLLDSNAVSSGRYNVIDLPTTFVIDRYGIIRAVRLGALDTGFLRRDIQPLLRSPG